VLEDTASVVEDLARTATDDAARPRHPEPL